jgi:hypothetical protein
MNGAQRAGPAYGFRGKLQHSRPLHRRGMARTRPPATSSGRGRDGQPSAGYCSPRTGSRGLPGKWHRIVVDRASRIRGRR